MSETNNNYFIQLKSGEEKISLNVDFSKDVADLDDNAIIEQVERALQSKEKASLKLSDKNIESIKKGTRQKEIDVGGWNIIIVKKVSPRKIKSQKFDKPSRAKLEKRLLKKWPVNEPIIGFAWKHAIVPILALFQSVKGGAEKREAARSVNKLVDSLGANDPRSFRRLLKRRKNQLERSSANSELTHELDKTISLHKNIEKNLDKPKELTDILQNVSSRIISRDPTTISSGFYHKGKFIPALYQFSYSDGKLVLNQFIYPRDEKIPSSSEYIFKENPTQKELQRLLGILITAQYPQAKLGTKESKNELALVDKLLIFNPGEGKKGAELKARKLQNEPHLFIDEAIKIAGGQLEGSTELSIKEGWDTIRSAFPGENNRDKFEYTFDIINDELDLLFQGFDQLSVTDQARHLKDIKGRVEQLKSNTNKAFGAEGAYQELFGKEGPFKTTSEKINQLEEIVEKRKSELSRKQLEAFEEKISISKKGEVKIKIPKEALRVEKTKIQFESPKNITEVHSKTLKTLSNQFKNQEVDNALQTLTEINKVVDKLLDKHQYAEAQELSDAILELLPVPSSETVSNDAFWNLLISGEHYDQFGNEVTKLAQFQWEAALHLHKRHMMPKQVINQMNVRAILVKIARTKIGDHITNYQTDIQPFLDVIHHHPHYRLGENPKDEQKLLAIENYLTTPAHDGGLSREDAKVIRLDAGVDLPSTAIHNNYSYGNDNSFINSYAGATGVDMNDMRDQMERAKNPENNIKPKELIDITRHTIFMQTMLRPDFGLALHFENSSLGQLAAINWFQARLKEAKENAPTSEQIKETMADLAFRDVHAKIENMGRLRLSAAKDYVIEDKWVVSIVDAENSSKKLNYLPWGLGLPQEISAQFKPEPDYNSASPLIGKVNQNHLRAGLGVEDRSLLTPIGLKGEKKPILHVKERQVFTEKGQLERALQREGGSALDEWQLSSLEVLQKDNQGGYALSLNNVTEAIDFIRTRPDQLENPEVRNQLQLIFTRPYLIQRLLRSNPDLIIEFGKDLQRIIEQKQSTDRDESLTFLLQLGESIIIHAKEAKEVLKNSKEPTSKYRTWHSEYIASIVPKKEPVVKSDPYRDRFKNDIEAKNYHKDKVLEKLEQILENTPALSNPISSDQQNQKIGSQLLEEWLKGKGNHSEVNAIIQLVQGYRQSHTNIDESQIEEFLQQPEKLHYFLSARPILQYAKYEVGIPARNIETLNWFEHKFLPELASYFEKNQSKRNDYLTAFAEDSGISNIKPVDWEKTSQQNPYLFKNGKVLLNLKTGELFIKGKRQEGAAKKIAIPKAVISQSSDYQRIFGTTERIALLSRGKSADEWVYTIRKGNHDFQIVYDSVSQKTELQLKTDNGTVYRYYKPDEISEEGIDSLIEEKGIWINLKDPSKGILFSENPTEATDASTFTLEINKQGEITKIKTDDKKVIVPDYDHKLSDLIHPTARKNILFLRDSNKSEVSEIRFIDHNLKIEKESEGKWVLKGELEGYYLVTDKNLSSGDAKKKLDPLIESLGDEFSQLGIRITDGKNVKLILWPHLINRVSGKKTNLDVITESTGSAPLVDISIDSQGKIKGSAAAFLYLSYIYSKKKDSRKAIHYLKLAEKNRLATKEDIALFHQVASNIQQADDKTLVDIAYKVKAELIINNIQREQIGTQAYNKNDWEKYYGSIQRLAKLHNLYYQKLGTREENTLHSLELLLNENEEQEFQILRSEAMRFYLDKYIENKAKQKEINPLEKVALTPLTEEQVTPELLYTIATFAQGDPDYSITKKQVEHILKVASALNNSPKERKKFKIDALGKELEKFLKKEYPDSKYEEAICKIVNKRVAFLENPEKQDYTIDSNKQDLIGFFRSGIQDFKYKTQLYSDQKGITNIIAEKLNNPPAITSQFILNHFVPYFNAIADGELKLEELNALFEPLEFEKGITLSTEEEKVNIAADKARRILLQAARMKANGQQVGKIDLDLFLIQQVQLSQSKVDIGSIGKSGAIMSAIKFIPIILASGDPNAAIGNKLYGKQKLTIELLKSIQTPIKKIFEKELEVTDAFPQGSKTALLPHVADQTLVSKSKKETAKKSKHAYPVNFQAIKDSLNSEDRSQLSPLEIHALEEITNGLDSEDLEKTEELNQVLKITQNQGFNLIDVRREHALKGRIETAEKRIKGKGTRTFALLSNQVIRDKVSTISSTDVYFDKPKQETDKLEGIKENGSELFTGGANPTEIEENRQIRKGIEEASNSLIESVNDSRVLKTKEVENLQKDLRVLISDEKPLAKGLKENRKAILNWARDIGKTKIPTIKKFIDQPDLYSEEELLGFLIETYQRQHQVGSPESNIEGISEAITLYLYNATAIDQIQNIIHIINTKLIPLKDKLDNEDNINEWAEMTKMIHATLSKINGKRYLNVEGKFEDPALGRKFLVAEYKNHVILREGQISVIKKLMEDPNQWVSLRMGLGKTSYIMPIVAMLLAEQGKLPAMLVPKPLKQMNISSFDTLTRETYGLAAQPFIATADESVSPAYLAEKYLNLLRAYESTGYLVTTVEDLATLKNLQVTLSEERKKLLESPQAKNLQKLDELDQSQIQLISQITEIERSLHWLSKIEALFNNASSSGIETQFFGDEIDSILHITKEINRAVNENVLLDTTITRTAGSLFTLILETKNPELIPLKEHLINGTQAGIKKSNLQEKYLPALAKALIESESFQQILNKDLKLDQQEFIDYLVGKKEERPSGLPKWNKELVGTAEGEQQKAIAVAKRLLSTTLADIFSEEPGIGFGFTEATGALVVPREGQNETIGNRFGNEYELIVYQYVGYIQGKKTQSLNGKTTEFIGNQLEKIKENEASLFAKIEEGAKNVNQSIIDYFLAPEQYNYRLDILNSVIFGGGYVNRSSEQVTLSVQTTVNGRQIGGVTGTLNPYALPNYDPIIEGEESTRNVEAETFIQIARTHEAGFDTPVHTFTENSKGITREFDAIIKDPKSAAIVLEGGYGLEGKNVLHLIQELREKTDRPFLFIHPTERVTYIWQKGKDHPERHPSKGLPQGTIVIYGPSDTRGTDVGILSGEVHYFPSKASNLQEMGQSIWRGRGTGEKHTPVWHVPTTLVKGATGDPHAIFTIGQAINAIKNKGLEKQAPVNLKAQLHRIKEAAQLEVRNILFSVNEELDDPQYWEFKKNDQNILANVAGNAILYKALRPFLIQSKAINFANDYEPTQNVDTTEKLIEDFDSQVDGLKNAKKRFIKEAVIYFKSIGFELEEFSAEEQEAFITQTLVAFKNDNRTGVPNLEKIRDAAKVSFQKSIFDKVAGELAKTEKRLGTKKEISKRLQELSKKPENDTLEKTLTSFTDEKIDSLVKKQQKLKNLSNLIKLKKKKKSSAKDEAEPLKQQAREQIKELITSEIESQFKEFGQKVEDGNLDIGLKILIKISSAARKIDHAIEVVNQKKEEFEKAKETHKKFLPGQVSKATAGEGGAQEQIQQQQQQQQQQQEVQSKPKSKSSTDLDDQLTNEFKTWKAAELNDISNSGTFIDVSKEVGDVGIEHAVRFTPEMQKIYKTLPGLQGEFVGRFALDKRGNVLIISKLDFHQIVSSGIRNKGHQAAVYTPSNNGIHLVEKGTVEIKIDHKKIAQAKFILGHSTFTQDENEGLNEWIKGLSKDQLVNLKRWVNKRGNREQQLRVISKAFTA